MIYYSIDMGENMFSNSYKEQAFDPCAEFVNYASSEDNFWIENTENRNKK